MAMVWYSCAFSQALNLTHILVTLVISPFSVFV